MASHESAASNPVQGCDGGHAWTASGCTVRARASIGRRNIAWRAVHGGDKLRHNDLIVGTVKIDLGG